MLTEALILFHTGDHSGGIDAVIFKHLNVYMYKKSERSFGTFWNSVYVTYIILEQSVDYQGVINSYILLAEVLLYESTK